MHGTVCALLCYTHRITERTTWPSNTFICLLYFHLRFEMNFHAASGTLTSYSSVIYTFDAGLPCDSWKRSNGQHNVAPSVALVSPLSMTLVGTLFILTRMRGLRAINSRNYGLSSFVAFVHSFPLPLIRNSFGVRTSLAMPEARINSNSPVGLVAFPRSTCNCSAPLQSRWVGLWVSHDPAQATLFRRTLFQEQSPLYFCRVAPFMMVWVALSPAQMLLRHDRMYASPSSRQFWGHFIIRSGTSDRSASLLPSVLSSHSLTLQRAVALRLFLSKSSTNEITPWERSKIAATTYLLFLQYRSRQPVKRLMVFR